MSTQQQEQREKRLPSLIRAHASLLTLPPDLGGEALLAALATQESDFGLLGGRSRVEPAYQPGGAIFVKHVVDLYADYGDAAASSYSSWQIMFVAAWELGFRGPPWELWDDAVAAKWVCKYIMKRAIKRGATTIEEIADAYNSGSHKDSYRPLKYMKNLATYYKRAEDILRRGETLRRLR